MARVEFIRNKFLLILLIAIVLFVFCVFYGFMSMQMSSETIRISIRGSTETYLFSLKENGVLEVFAGDRHIGEIKETDISIVKKKRVRLSKTQLAQLNPVVNEILKTEDLKDPDTIVNDACWVTVYTKGKLFKFPYGMATNPEFDVLVEKLIEYSPIEVVGGYPVDFKN